MVWGEPIDLAADYVGKINRSWSGIGNATVYGLKRLGIDESGVRVLGKGEAFRKDHIIMAERCLVAFLICVMAPTVVLAAEPGKTEGTGQVVDPMQAADAAPLSWKDAGIVDTRASAHAALRSVPIHAVRMTDGFWRTRMQGNRRGLDAFLEWLDRDDQTAPFRASARFARTGDASGIDAGLEALRRNAQPHPWRANTQTWLEACG